MKMSQPLAAELLLELEGGLAVGLAVLEPQADSHQHQYNYQDDRREQCSFVIFFILAAPGCNLYPAEIFYRKASR